MKILFRLFFLTILSVGIAAAFFFINHKVIVASTEDKIYEVLVTAIPVFIVVSLLYFINRAIVKTVKGLKTKKPSK